jgi:superoxide reductase
MANRNEVYKCEICGNIVAVLHASDGELFCCGKEMTLLKENSVDAAKEKHVPVIEKKGDSYTVKVGSLAHPMEEKHYIEFIELMTENRIYRAFLSPGKEPQAEFEVHCKVIGARALCNIHGLWKSA